MSAETQIIRLVLQWQDRRQQGQTITPEELCHDSPELLPRLREALRDLPAVEPLVPPSTAAGTLALTPLAASTGANPRAGTAAVGRYEPRQFHARGGLGEVHRADDRELHRPVALKCMQEPFADDPASRRRFLREAALTARLQHPGIVPVYGLTQDEQGRPAYAMRFIEGQSLKEAIDRFHAADVPGRDPVERNLALRQLLGRFVTACKTIAYAHSRGIIHLDLKPGNIMLGAYDETLVVDWGLARPCAASTAEPAGGPLPPEIAEDEASRPAGWAPGTPPYMSPEQAAGRWDVIGPASDVYSLGATLYVLLTGRTPYTGSAPVILQQVQQGQFPRPGQFKPNMPRALEAICLKAMAVSPTARYATALAFAEDVEHWLADEAVTAYRAPWPARLGRWARRHPALVAAAVALLLTATGASAVGTLLLRQRERVAQAARARADRNFRLAQDAVEQTVTKVADNEQLRQGNFHALRKALLASAVPFYEEFVQQRSDDPQLEAERGRAYGRLAYVRSLLGETEAAQADYAEVLAIFKRLAADYPAVPEFRHQLARNRNNLGLLLKDLGKPATAEVEYRQARALHARLVADFPAVPEYRCDLAKHHNNLGVLLVALGRQAAAEAEYRAALALQGPLAADFPAVPEYRQSLSTGHHNLGLLLKDLGQPTAAEAEYCRAIALQEKLAADFPAVPAYRHDLALSHNNLGILLEHLGKRTEAETEYRQALAFRARLTADLPAVPAYRQDLAVSHLNLGTLLMALGGPPEAEREYRQAVAVQERLAADFPAVPAYRHDLAHSHNNLGVLLDNLRRHAEAETEYRAALALYAPLAADFPTVPEHRLDLADCHNNLATLLMAEGKWPAAEASFREALVLYEPLAADYPTVPEYRHQLARSRYNLGVLLKNLRKYPEAEAAYRQAIAVREKLVAEFPSVPAYRLDLSGSQYSLAILLTALGKWAEAEAEYRQAIALQERLVADCPTVPDYRQKLASSHNNRAIPLGLLGKQEEAEAEIHRALVLREQLTTDFPTVPDYAVDLGTSYLNWALIVHRRGQAVASLDWYAKALATLRPVLATEPHLASARLVLRNAHWNRAGTLGHLGRHAEAVADWEQALALNDEKPRAGWFGLQRASSLARAGHPVKATIAVEEVLKPGNAISGTLYDAACVYALAAAQATKEAPPNTSSLHAEQYARRAVALLRQAVQKGYKNVAHMKKDTDLDALRQRPDFHQLLADLEAKAPAK